MIKTRLILQAILLIKSWPLQTVRSCFAFQRNLEMATVKVLVDQKIHAKKVMIFSKSYCPFCTKAKKVFKKLIEENQLSSEDFEVMEIENDSNCEAIQNYLQTITGARSVPRVFINGKCIGGGDDVVEAHENGKLVKLLSA